MKLFFPSFIEKKHIYFDFIKKEEVKSTEFA